MHRENRIFTTKDMKGHEGVRIKARLQARRMVHPFFRRLLGAAPAKHAGGRIDLGWPARRRVGVFLHFVVLLRSYWIVVDVVLLILEGLRTENTDLGKSFLPDGGSEPQFLPCPKFEATLHKLHGALDRRKAFGEIASQSVRIAAGFCVPRCRR